MNCLDIAIGAYTDLTLLNFAGLSFVAMELSLIPFAIPPLWKKLRFLHSNFEVKVSRAKHPRYERVGLPVLAGFLIGAAIVLWFISLTASVTASNYNAFLVFTCPQPLLVLGLAGTIFSIHYADIESPLHPSRTLTIFCIFTQLFGKGSAHT
jgi:hypothetical protein